MTFFVSYQPEMTLVTEKIRSKILKILIIFLLYITI